MAVPVQNQNIATTSSGDGRRPRPAGEERHLSEEFPRSDVPEERSTAVGLELTTLDNHQRRVLDPLVEHARTGRQVDPPKLGESGLDVGVRQTSKDGVRLRLPAWALLLAAITAGCAGRGHLWTGPLRTLGEYSAEPRSPVEVFGRDAELGDTIADAARNYLATPPVGFRSDCSGFVEAVLDRAGAGTLRGNTRDFWNTSTARGFVHHRRRPRVGDLAFFDDTWDRNGNGRLDDDLTHLAVVIDVEADGTVVMAHVSSSKGRTTLRMNLFQPDVPAVDHHRLNDHLRRASSTRNPVPTLAGELWRGFATITGDAVAWVD